MWLEMNAEYEDALSMLKLRDANDRTEEDVKAEIVEPVLRSALGYASDCIFRENQLDAKRPDFVCRRTNGELDLIVEAKALEVNLDLRPSKSAPATRIPKVQLEEYLRKRPDSKHGVFGLLTNGEEWRVCQRIENDVVWMSKVLASNRLGLQNALQPLINRATLPKAKTKYSTERGQKILGQIRSAQNHQDLLESLELSERVIEEQTDLVSSLQLANSTGNSDYLFIENCFVTIGSLADDGVLAVADVHGALRETDLLDPAMRTSGIGIAHDSQVEAVTACRIFARDGTRLHTSNAFHPDLPGTRVLRQLESLAKWIEGEPNDLIEQLNARTVQKEFYDEIARWFDRTGTELNDLRHLIRVLFSWFLKEHGVIPTELFEKHEEILIHDQLVHLFTKTLSMEPIRRKVPKQLIHLRDVFEDAPFLNGSLFNDDSRLLRSQLTDADYIGAGEDDSGLFTILKRYEWTLTEHDQIRSDTALDPSMIGSVFERFVALAENITPGPLARQPDGTYYTPQDLTDEMVCDALAHDLALNINGVTFSDAFDLLHPTQVDSAGATKLRKPRLKRKILQRLREVSVLDPCTGSGEFIVSVLNALRRAEENLLSNYNDFERIQHAVANQLYAVDVNPIAIQVTRFRFYLAMVGTQLALQPNHPIAPFPNLETRIAAANSLATRLMDEELASLGSQLNSADMLEWRDVRDSYTYIHNVDEKKQLRDDENKAREKLIRSNPHAMRHVMDWLQNESLGNENIVAQCGLSFLFGKEHWDIVIGNPPYQKPTIEEKDMARRYGYRTAPCGNLYCLFVELGIKLINDNGNLTMVVPHSICFADTKQTLRDISINVARSVQLRTYNNRPAPVFPPHPFIKGGNQGAQSRQRVTIVSITGKTDSDSTPSINASCYIGLQDSRRKEILRKRPTYPQPNSDTWTMAGTEELARLLVEMRGDNAMPNPGGKSRYITFPPTAYYFLTCLPQEVLDSSRRKKISVPDDDFFWSRICLFNSSVFHAYWLMVGDAFHVLPRLFTSVRLPPSWETDSSVGAVAEEIGREFCSEDVLHRSSTVFRQAGKEFPNYDFHTNAPDLVKKADQICIEGYGLKELEPRLQEQLQKIRYFQTWDM